jgi:prepilin-type N-terminal cleavage/methylation domain-containing protein
MKRWVQPIQPTALVRTLMIIDRRLSPPNARPATRQAVAVPTAGFSLLEVLVVVAIVAVLASIAVPNLLAARAGYQIHTAGATAVNRLGEARMEAVKRNRFVTVTLDNAQRSMLTTCLDDAGVPMTLAGPEFMPTDVVFDMPDGAATMAIQFDSMGRPVNPPQTFTLRHTRSDQRRVLTIVSTGRLTVDQP